MSSLFKYLLVLLFIVIFFMIGRVYANTSYYSSKNNCEYGEQPELADCLRNELIESTIMLKEAEDNIKQRIQKWSAEKSASLDEAIPVALYKLDESHKVFVRYRFTQCAFAESWGNGVGSFTRIFSCMAELNRQRAKQLMNADIPDYAKD